MQAVRVRGACEEDLRAVFPALVGEQYGALLGTSDTNGVETYELRSGAEVTVWAMALDTVYGVTASDASLAREVLAEVMSAARR